MFTLVIIVFGCVIHISGMWWLDFVPWIHAKGTRRLWHVYASALRGKAAAYLRRCGLSNKNVLLQLCKHECKPYRSPVLNGFCAVATLQWNFCHSNSNLMVFFQPCFFFLTYFHCTKSISMNTRGAHWFAPDFMCEIPENVHPHLATRSREWAESHSLSAQWRVW